MSVMHTKFISLNVNGLRMVNSGMPKRRKVFTWLKRQQADIFFLQETHSVPNDETFWLSEWGGLGFFSHGDDKSRGVAILIRPGFPIDVEQVQSSENGRFLVLKAKIREQLLTLGCIYGPNRDTVDDFERFFECCDKVKDSQVIIGGDFNLFFDRGMDRVTSSKRITSNERCRRFVTEYMRENDLVDTWRSLNPETKSYTCHRSNPISKSRIDFFLTSRSFLFEKVKPAADILNGYLSDHRMCTLGVLIGKVPTGKSFWKFNNSLLSDDTFVSRAKEKITQIIDDNDLAEISRTTLLGTVLCVLRGWIIQYASHKKKEERAYLKRLDEAINEAQRDGVSRDVISEMGEERDEYVQKVTAKNMLNCKANWRQFAEKGTKYFHGLNRRNASRSTLKAMELQYTDPGALSSDSSAMLKEAQAYFQNMYAARQMADNIEQVLDNIPMLSEEKAARCEGVITEGEIEAALKSMSTSTSPGPDGFTVPFFRMFWDDLKHLLVSVFTEMYETGIMPNLYKQSVTILIPKKGKDLTKIDSMRPINLLNVVYKILTKALSGRLAIVIQEIINEDQTGFIKGRYIGENVRLIIDIIRRSKARNTPGLLLFCDWQKAYDSVNWTYLKEAFKRFGFGVTMQKWIDILYDQTGVTQSSAQVQINGFLSQPYEISSGLRQGCPLSCMLFLIAIEPLACSVRASSEISGLRFGSVEMKISAYADDTVMILDGSAKSLSFCFEQLKRVEEVSGLRLNKRKTRAMWIESNRNRQDRICPDIDVSWDVSPVEYLGIKLNRTGEKLASLNYPEKIGRLKERLNPWFARNITPYGKVHIIKSEALSQLAYLMSVLEKPGKSEIAEINTIVYKFIWKTSKDRVKRTVMRNSLRRGGLNVPDPDRQADSLKVVWVKKLLDPKNKGKWKEVMRDKLFVNDRISLFHCDASPGQIRARLGNDRFWEEVLIAWMTIVGTKQAQNKGSDILGKVLWLNRDLDLENVGGVNRQQMIGRSIIHVADLYNRQEHRLHTSAELQHKYGCGNFLTWQSLLHSIPISWKEILSKEKPESVSFPVAVEEIQTIGRPAKWGYMALIDTSMRPQRAQTAWEDQLRVRNLQWDGVYRDIYQCTNDFKLLWLQFRILHRILPSNRLLFHFKILQSDQCKRCGRAREDILHMLWQCPGSQRFWRSFTSKLKLRAPLTVQQVILNIFKAADVGIQSPSNTNTSMSLKALRLSAMLGKQFIWYCRNKECDPSLDGYCHFVRRYRDVERCVATREGKTEQFNQLWEVLANRLDVNSVEGQ